MNRKFWAAIVTGLMCVVLTACARPAPQTVTVFAAASLTEVMTQIAADFEAGDGSTVRLSFGASGSVARQIQAGAPADVVILADPTWMDRLAADQRLGQARFDLVSNDLVVIAPTGAVASGDPFGGLSAGRVAIGDPESVPAGAYARTWLQATGRWDAVRDRLVFASDVRGVRAFVARREAAMGIVYRSDTVGQEDVTIVLAPPRAEQPLILYPAAETAEGGAQARTFLAYLKTPASAATFRRFGFEPVA